MLSAVEESGGTPANPQTQQEQEVMLVTVRHRQGLCVTQCHGSRDLPGTPGLPEAKAALLQSHPASWGLGSPEKTTALLLLLLLISLNSSFLLQP